MFLLWAMATLMLPLSLQAQDIHERYTREHPLVYEDAWDLWPYVFLDEEGNPTGYNVDMLKLILDDIGIPYVIKLKPTSEALADLYDGKSNLMCGMKAHYHDKHATYYSENIIQLFTHSLALPKDKPVKIVSFEDLKNNEVIVHDGAFSHHLLIDSGWVDKLRPYHDMDKAVQQVCSDGEGQILWNTMSLKWLISKYGAGKMKLEPVDMPFGEYHFMSNDRELMELIDQSYSRLATNEKLTALQTKWFYPETTSGRNMPQWIWYVAIAAALMALMLISFYVILKMRESKATAESQSRNNRLRKILQSSNIGLWTYDIKTGTFTLYRENGMPGRTYPTKLFSQRYSPEGFKTLQEAIDKVVNMKAPEVRLQIQSTEIGETEEHTYDANISVLRKKNGLPVMLIGTRKDISAQRERQQLISDIHTRYHSVFSTSVVDMIYFDSNGFISNMNERSQRTFNMTLSEAIANHVSMQQLTGIEELNFNDRDFFYATLKMTKEGSDGQKSSNIYYELQLVPVYDSAHMLMGIYGSGLDITGNVHAFQERRKTLQELSNANQSQSRYISNINYAMTVGGLSTLIYTPSDHMLNIYQRIDKVMFSLTQSRCLTLIMPESQKVALRMFNCVDKLVNQPLTCEVKTIINNKKGKRMHLYIQLYPVTDKDGHVKLYNGVCRDVTKFRETEALLQTETLKAQEIETIKKSFLHNMCYEIRTPLNAVVGFAELFDHNHQTEDEDVFINEIKNNSAYLLQLINDILFLSRLDANMIEIKKQPIDFACTFEAHCHIGWEAYKKEGVNYIVENPYNQLVVDIDDENLGHIIEQVTRNAAEHTTTGSVHTRYEYIGNKLVISVTDTGEGIPDDMIDHLYERFRQGANSNHGTGLGLPICKELADQMGGTIDITSETGKGTSVWITIPCKVTAMNRKLEI